MELNTQSNNSEPTPLTNNNEPNTHAPESHSVFSSTDHTQSNLVTSTTTDHHSSAGIIILQWFVYAFWGWTVLAMSWLTFIVFLYFLDKSSNVIEVIPYAIASVIVLLPVAVICDIFYTRHEPAKKQGFSMGVMLTHVVIFSLLGIGTLIGAVFSFINLLIGDNQTSSLAVTLSLIVITILFAATLLRTIRPRRASWLVRTFIIFMSLVAGTFIVLTIVGPLANARELKTDRLLESHLDSVKTGIDSYVESNSKLPSSLGDISIDRDAKQLVNDKLVEYKNEGEVSKVSANISKNLKITTQDAINNNKTFHYQLCVTYKKASGYTTSYEPLSGDAYSTYLSSYSHPAGYTCYKLEKVLYSYDYSDSIKY